MAEEDDLIQLCITQLRRQKSHLKQALAYKGQKPPASLKRSRQDLEQEFMIAATKANMRVLSNQISFRSCFIGAEYPPCTLPLSSLTPIALRDLKLETQHRGRVLIVRAFSVPNNMMSIQNAVEDELGDVERLSIYNLLPTTVANAVLPRGAVVAVKEPYYKRTADGGLFVRVDHPTDFVPLKPGDNLIPPRLAAACTTSATLSACRLKEDGNAAFKRGDFQVAADLYSDAALDASGRGDADDLWQDLRRNRAAAYLHLGRYELAITDALASIVSTENTSDAAARDGNVKALYRAGKAAYSMQDFAQAKQHFSQALELNRDHKEVRAELSRTMKRLSEQENGDYDFSTMARSATMQHTLLDHASFLGRTKVAPIETRGRGLFATEMLNAGDIVFVEKAFHVAHHAAGDRDISVIINLNTDRVSLGSHSLRLYGIIDKMIWNPTLANRYLDLFDGDKYGSEKEVKVVDGGKAAVDTFRVQSIAELNGFGCPRVKSRDKGQSDKQTPDREQSTGIWLRASYANHSCLPNTTRAFIGDMMVVRAVRDIPAGGEIFTIYLDSCEPVAERRKRLKDGYGFECDCDLCRADATVPKATVEKRARLREEVTSFLSANRHHLNNDDSTLATIPAAKIAKARKLLEDVRNTYPKARFERLPRLGCDDLGLWVARIVSGRRRTRRLRDLQDALASFLAVLRDLGYFVTIRGSDVAVDRGAAVQRENAIHAAMYAAQCLAAMGNVGAAGALEDLSRCVYTTVSGAEKGFAEDFTER